jgi:transposase
MEKQENKSVESPKPETARQLISRVKRYGRRKVSAEDKIRIVLEGLRGEESVSDVCRRESVSKPTYYQWVKVFLEAGKKRLLGDHVREATSNEVMDLRRENAELKALLAEKALENWRLKKSHLGEG